MKKRPEYDLIKTGNQIRKLRKERNISVDQIRKYMQFNSSQAIYKWEKGLCFPQADNLLALAKLFDVNPNEILIENDIFSDYKIRDIILLFIRLKNEDSTHNTIYEYTLIQ